MKWNNRMSYSWTALCNICFDFMFYLCVYECVGGGGYIYIYIGASKIVIRTLGLILALGIKL